MLISEDFKALVIFGCLLLLIVLLFRVVGAVRLSDTLTRLQDKHADACLQRNERKTFEYLQLRFRQIDGFEQWWQAVCEAATGMDFAWVALKTTFGDGRIEEEIWRAPEVKPDLTRLVTMTIPLACPDGRASGGGDARLVGCPTLDGTSRATATAGPFLQRQVEIAICTNGSLEAAGRRATLFSRLLDESQVPRTAGRSG
jgi:hypothetical protein